jgi:hypothetical protein
MVNLMPSLHPANEQYAESEIKALYVENAGQDFWRCKNNVGLAAWKRLYLPNIQIQTELDWAKS